MNEKIEPYKKKKELELKIDDKFNINFNEASLKLERCYFAEIGCLLEHYIKEFNKLPVEEQEKLKTSRDINLINDIISTEKDIAKYIDTSKSNLENTVIDPIYSIKLDNGCYALFKDGDSYGKYGRFNNVLWCYYTIIIKKGSHNCLGDILECQKKVLEIVKKYQI